MNRRDNLYNSIRHTNRNHLRVLLPRENMKVSKYVLKIGWLGLGQVDRVDPEAS